MGKLWNRPNKAVVSGWKTDLYICKCLVCTVRFTENEMHQATCLSLAMSLSVKPIVHSLINNDTVQHRAGHKNTTKTTVHLYAFSSSCPSTSPWHCFWNAMCILKNNNYKMRCLTILNLNDIYQMFYFSLLISKNKFLLCW